ncbi:patatin/phospholipase-like protein [Chloropicon primus]|uniref:Patatin n=2 Tax=Chloropicon primus TaxID=1764295 RepID=A0A5B8MI74_9CHLO|nr:patatin/phospholipase-like protein [Chloropicon primus]UPQ99365.1 patatin/phospholipase-like protein [Chloropicon primus]|eukprot:QDZ20153.1 patatin/phospholipase-like protein [Chloropicon primus]
MRTTVQKLGTRVDTAAGGTRRMVSSSPPSSSSSCVATRVLQERGASQGLVSWEFDPLEGIAGTELHPVLEVVRNRFEGRAKDDGFKLGLVVEGGGMRGITSAGMLVELQRKGFGKIFDAVYGSSAGAINLTYFLSRDDTGADIYHKHIANRDFISLSRLWRRRKGDAKPVLDISYLLDYVMEDVLPLDWDRVVNAETPLKVVASHIDGSGGSRPVLLEGFRDKADLKESLRASACVPGIAGGPVYHRGHTLVDAMVHEPIPIWSAIDDGCTHVLTLCSKPKFEGRNWMTVMKRNFIRDWFMNPRYLGGRVYKQVEAHEKGSLNTERMLWEDCPQRQRETFGANVFTLFPETQPVGSLSRNVEKLQEARMEGHTAVQDLYAALFEEYPVLPRL